MALTAAQKAQQLKEQQTRALQTITDKSITQQYNAVNIPRVVPTGSKTPNFQTTLNTSAASINANAPKGVQLTQMAANAAARKPAVYPQIAPLGSGMNPEYAKKQAALLAGTTYTPPSVAPTGTSGTSTSGTGTSGTGTAGTPSGSTGNAYQQTLQDLGFGSGKLSTIQQIINEMSVGTAEERETKDRAQAALQGLSGSGSIYFDSPYGVSADEKLADIRKVKGEFEMKSEKKKTALELQIEQLNKIDESQFAQQRTIAGAAIAGEEAQFAQGREGVVSEANPLIAKQFKTQVNTDLENKRTQLSMAQTQRAEQMAALEEAIKNGNEELATSISKNLSDSGQKIQKLKDESAKLAADANKEAKEQLDKVTSLMSANPIGFSALTPEQLQSTYGLTPDAALSLSSTAKSLAILKKDDPAYKLNVKQLENYGLTDIDKKVDAIATLRYLGKNDMADAIERSIPGWSGSQEQINQTNKIQNDITEQVDTYDKTGSWVPKNSVYENSIGSKNQLITSLQDSVGQIPPNGRGQCGEVNNDFLGKGIRIFGDSYESKFDEKNSDKPVVGGSFIMKIEGYPPGHVGIITQVYDDGSFDLIDSNRDDNLKVKTGAVKGSDYLSYGITGFFDPSKPATGWNPMGVTSTEAGRPTELKRIGTLGAEEPQPIIYGTLLADTTMEDLAQQYAVDPTAKLSELTAYANTKTGNAPPGSKFEKVEQQKALGQMIARATEIKQQNLQATSINEVSPDMREVIEGLINYDVDLSTVTSKFKSGGKELQHIYALAAEEARNRGIDWKQSDYKARQAFKQKWASGKIDDAVIAVNKVTNHIIELADSVEQLGGFGMLGLQTKLGALGGQQLKRVLPGGNPALVSYETNSQAVVDELERVFSSTGGSQASKEERRVNFSPSNTEAEQKSAINKSVNLMLGQVEPLISDYERNMGNLPPVSILNKETIQNLYDLANNGYIKSDTFKRAFDLYQRTKPKEELITAASEVDIGALPPNWQPETNATPSNTDIINAATQTAPKPKR